MGRFDYERSKFTDPVNPAHPLRYVELWRPAWCNCILWAQHMQKRYGGYITQRRSVVFWRWWRGGQDHPAFWPHAMWSPDGAACFEYTQDKPDYLPWWKLPTMLLFRGRVEEITRQWL